MANRILTDDIIGKRGLAQMINSLGIVQRVNRDYQAEFKKVGESVQYRLPVRAQNTTGMSLQLQPLVEQTRSIILRGWAQQAFDFSQRDYALDIADLDSRHILPRVRTMANYMDKSIVDNYWKIANCAGNGGTQPATAAVFTNARAKLRAIGTPEDDMYTLGLNPTTDAAIQNGIITPSTSAIYNPEMAMKSFVKGQLAYPVAGMTTLTTANMPNHTFGTFWNGSTLVKGTTFTHDPAANTTTITMDGGATTGTVKKGDLITISGSVAAATSTVNSVNQMNYQDTGFRQDFTVVQDGTASGGELAIVVSPCMNDGTLTTTDPNTGNSVSLAAYQNVTRVPVDNAVVTARGTAGLTYTQDLIFHKSCFSFVQVDVESPYGFAGGKQSHGGFSMTCSKAGDIQNYRSIMRFDSLFGTDVTYPEMGMRVLGAALS